MLPDPVTANPFEFTPNIDKSVVTRGGVEVYITDVFTGKGPVKANGAQSVYFLEKDGDEPVLETYRKAVSVAVIEVEGKRA